MVRLRLHLPLVAVLLGLAPGTRAAAPRDVAGLLGPVRERHGVPGMAGAVVTAAGLEAIGADGVRERGRAERVTVDDRWHLGSCTKSMTATLCAMLVEDGKLAFGTTVGSVFGDVKDADRAWRPVTLELLLTNRAGAPPNLDADGLWTRLRRHAGTPTEQRRALVEGVLRRPPEATPGTKYVYSNAGFAIAGAMAETLAKSPWESLLRTRLFEPLGMKSAGFGAPGSAEELDEPRGHRADGTPVPPGRNADNPAAIGPAGTVHASIGDWARYAQFHLTGERPGATKLLSPASFATLHTPSADASSYAMGWGVAERPWAGGRALTHSGSNTMWYCTVWIAPEKGFAVLVACNQGGEKAAKACDEACSALIRDHAAASGAK